MLPSFCFCFLFIGEPFNWLGANLAFDDSSDTVSNPDLAVTRPFELVEETVPPAPEEIVPVHQFNLESTVALSSAVSVLQLFYHGQIIFVDGQATPSPAVSLPGESDEERGRRYDELLLMASGLNHCIRVGWLCLVRMSSIGNSLRDVVAFTTIGLAAFSLDWSSTVPTGFISPGDAESAVLLSDLTLLLINRTGNFPTFSPFV
jgi:hypothetical protein